jgi:hypothetical protein
MAIIELYDDAAAGDAVRPSQRYRTASGPRSFDDCAPAPR